MDQSENLLQIRFKGTTATAWVPQSVVSNQPPPTPTPTPTPVPTPIPTPLTEEELKKMEAEEKQFEDSDAEWNRYKQIEVQRKAKYEAEHEEAPIVIGAKPAPQ
jgi:hypothetical protein